MSQPVPDSSSQTSAEIDRRGWLRAVIGVIGVSIASVLGVVVGGAVLGPSFERRRTRWIPAGRLGALEANVPMPVTLRVPRQDGYYESVEQQVVFLVRSEAGDVRALSSTCTHLGCRVSYDAEKKLITCPCHGGVYSPGGRVIAGPPPRPLPELAARVEGSRVLVEI